jgi:hypothetical protein
MQNRPKLKQLCELSGEAGEMHKACHYGSGNRHRIDTVRPALPGQCQAYGCLAAIRLYITTGETRPLHPGRWRRSILLYQRGSGRIPVRVVKRLFVRSVYDDLVFDSSWSNTQILPNAQPSNPGIPRQVFRSNACVILFTAAAIQETGDAAHSLLDYALM